jgi:hypothetical protein
MNRTQKLVAFIPFEICASVLFELGACLSVQYSALEHDTYESQQCYLVRKSGTRIQICQLINKQAQKGVGDS